MIRLALPLALAGALAAPLALPAAAQDATADARALAERYVGMPAVQDMMTSMFSPEAMGAQLMAALPPGLAVSEDQMARVGALMSEGMAGLRPSLEAAMVDASATAYTPEELQAMIDFYGSEVGASVLAKTQPMMAQVMAQVAPEMQAAQASLGPQIQAILMEGQ